MSVLFPLSRSVDTVRRKYADAPDDMPLDAGHEVFLGNSVTRRQAIGLACMTLIVAGAFLARAAHLQIVQGSEYRNLAEGNRLRNIPLEAKRGLITDVNGEILAENVPTFYLSIVPEYLPKDPMDRAEVLLRIADATGIAPFDMEEELASASRDESEPVIIHHELTKDTALRAMVELRTVRSAIVAAGSKRSYPESATVPSLSHILGYTGKLTREDLPSLLTKGYLRSDLVGKTGLESTYESELRGTYGRKRVEVDVKGNIERIIASEAKTDGATLKLAIDANLQAAAEQALAHAFKKSGTNRGVVIAMDPRNGRIRALVSLPAYDNNLFGGGIAREAYRALVEDERQPLFNRAVSGEYPSGSTLKIVYAAAALAEGIVSDATTVNSVGGIRIGAWFFPDWKAGGHGMVNVRKAIAWSVNTFFYMISGGLDQFRGLGIAKMGEWVAKFGLGTKLGIDIPGERAGFYPTPEWKERDRKEPWYIGDTYHAGIGQGMVLVTPLQVAAYTSVFANGGTLYAPTLVSSITVPDLPEREVAPKVIRSDIASKEAIELVRRGMREAVTYGSARALSDLPFAVAGKTGTAQFQSDKHPHAWFSGFAPYDKPTLVVTVLIEEGIEGSTNAVPVAKEVLKAYLHE